MSAYPPVIIIGMSRSGTSMLTRMLEAVGLFVGKEKTLSSHEAVFFQRLNKWLLSQCSGGLEHPSSIKYLLEDNEARMLFAEFIRYILKTPRTVSFLGWGKFLRYRNLTALDIPWGWKDPRNTYTLPIWLDIFPNAKVIHIYRHGVDVVNSLRVRHDRGLARLKKRHPKFKPLYWFYLIQRFLFTDRKFVYLRCASLEDGLSMWEEYVQEARTHVRNLEGRAVEVKYEDLLAEPARTLKSLTKFCGIVATDQDIEKAARQARKDRAYAYRGNPELEAFASLVSDRLKAKGY